jgi:RNA processing factor Prp31
MSSALDPELTFTNETESLIRVNNQYFEMIRKCGIMNRLKDNNYSCLEAERHLANLIIIHNHNSSTQVSMSNPRLTINK